MDQCEPGRHVVPKPRTEIKVCETEMEMLTHHDERYFSCERCGALVDIGSSSALVTTRDFAERLAACEDLRDIYDLAKTAHLPRG